jgi:hypothetical protein
MRCSEGRHQYCQRTIDHRPSYGSNSNPNCSQNATACLFSTLTIASSRFAPRPLARLVASSMSSPAIPARRKSSSTASRYRWQRQPSQPTMTVPTMRESRSATTSESGSCEISRCASRWWPGCLVGPAARFHSSTISSMSSGVAERVTVTGPFCPNLSSGETIGRPLRSRPASVTGGFTCHRVGDPLRHFDTGWFRCASHYGDKDEKSLCDKATGP